VEAAEDVLVAGEGFVVGDDNAWGPHGGTLSAFPLKRKGGYTEILHSPCSFRMTLGSLCPHSERSEEFQNLVTLTKH
jgi:hypothetical protein